MTPEVLGKERTVDHAYHFSRYDFIEAIDRYLDENAERHILRPYQSPIFHDVQEFLRSNDYKGDIVSPTGSGKTVVFVELTKALMKAGETAPRTPRFLVVTPTKDLVHQTISKDGQKGYGKFAQDLVVGSYFSDSNKADREVLNTADVVVTTYDSFSLMSTREEVRPRTEEEKKEYYNDCVADIIKNHGTGFDDLLIQLKALNHKLKDIPGIPTGRTLLEAFDLIFFDEEHHLLGKTYGGIVDTIGRGQLIIGFTATPDANEKRKVRRHIPYRIHTLSFREAVGMEILAPLAIAAINTKVKLEGSDLYDAEGEYIEEKLNYLGRSSQRNASIINTAKILAHRNIGTIIPCVQGDEALHARLLAERLRQEGVSAEAVYSSVPSRQRAEIYKSFENGEIDVLTSVRILGEGWDSDRAKAIINARPTRSQIIAQQRLGRIMRPGAVAIALDMIDEYDPLNPPLHIPDLLEESNLPSGYILGNITAEQQAYVQNLIKEIGKTVLIAAEVPADYSNFQAMLNAYPAIQNGKLLSSVGHYATSRHIGTSYRGVTDEILEKLWGDSSYELDIVQGVQGYTIRNAYNVKKAQELLSKVPVCEPDRAFVQDNKKWMSTEGLAIVFSKRYPASNAKIISNLLMESGDLIEWRPLKYKLPKQIYIIGTGGGAIYECYKGYLVDSETISRIDNKLGEYFTNLPEVSPID